VDLPLTRPDDRLSSGLFHDKPDIPKIKASDVVDDPTATIDPDDLRDTPIP
jgi:hypothetical protein